MEQYVPIIAGLLGALLGSGGVAAWVRAGGQNKGEYLGRLLERLAQVEARTDTQDAALLEQGRANSELARSLAREQGERAQLQRSFEQLDTLSHDLTAQVGKLSERVSEETKERARAIHAEQVQKSRAEFLERENNTLRAEVTRLQRALPQRSIANTE